MAISAVGAAPNLSHAASSRPKPQAEVLRTNPEVIAFTQRKQASMTNGAFTPTVVQGGLVGALALVATKAVIEHVSGANLVEKHQLVDPATGMSRDVARILAEQRGAVTTEQPMSIKGERPKAIAKVADGARYIVDIRTVQWDLAGSSIDAGRQEASYMATLRIVDGLTGVVAVETECRWAAPVIKIPEVSRPTDKGDNLRDHFATAREACIEQLKIGMRSLYLPTTRLAEISRQAPRDAQTFALAPLPRPAEPSQVEYHAPPIRPVATAVLTPVPPAASPSPSPQRLSPPAAYAEPLPRPAPPQIERRAPIVAAAPAPALVVASRPTSSYPRASPAAAYAQVEPRRESSPARPLPPYAEYPYARPYEAPPSRTLPPPEVRYAGRDANGYLTWPGKRP
jgi:hypothetical protein